MGDTALAATPDGSAAAVGFVRLLRAAGLAVPVGAGVTFAEALAVLGWSDARSVYWAGRATLCRRPEDAERFDECFRAWFDAPGRQVAAAPTAPTPVVVGLDHLHDAATESDATDAGAEAPVVTVRFSRAESLRNRDFARYSPAEHDEARRLLADVRLVGSRRRSRRRAPVRSGHRRPDVARTVRAALRTDGEPLTRAWKGPTPRVRRLVVLCDVSGSMEPYSRVIVRFLHTTVTGRARVEAFVMGTRLTRITRDLTTRDPDAAIAAASRRVVDWSGGTRLGETLRTFNETWGLRGMARGADVVVVSDGWDRGEPELLAEQMARLSRVAHRIVWVNPLKASPGFAPLAAGMAAALPFVDDFVEGHSIASLEALVRVLDEVRR
ncbi:MAG: vWA domain-containing protein [Acidimicrobiia bacterium]